MLAAATVCAQGDTAYTINASDAMLRTVDLATAATLTTNPITTSNSGAVQWCNGMAYDATTNTLFAILRVAGSNVRQLAVLDPSTAVATVLGPMPDKFSGLAVRIDGVLFGVTGDGATTPETLWTLDPLTQAATQVTSLGNGNDGEAIGFADDLFLYHASGFGVQNVDEVFERVDTFGALTITPVTLSGHDYDELTALTGYTGGAMLAADLNDSLLLLTTGGHATVLGTLDHGPVRGIAVIPSPTTQPFFHAYGVGCAAGSGAIPALFGSGTPTPGVTVSIELRAAPAGSFGLFALGTGQLAAPIPSPACQVQINPVLGTNVAFTDPTGAVSLTLPLPPGLSPGDFFMQMGVLDGVGFVVSNPLQMHLR